MLERGGEVKEDIVSSTSEIQPNSACAKTQEPINSKANLGSGARKGNGPVG
jgi:hypothetical protein